MPYDISIIVLKIIEKKIKLYKNLAHVKSHDILRAGFTNETRLNLTASSDHYIHGVRLSVQNFPNLAIYKSCKFSDPPGPI